MKYRNAVLCSLPYVDIRRQSRVL